MYPVEAYGTLPAITVPSTSSLLEAARLMYQEGFRHLPVADPGEMHRRVLTDVDLYRRGRLTGSRHNVWEPLDLHDRASTVGDIARLAPPPAPPSTPVHHVLSRLLHDGEDFVLIEGGAHDTVGIFTEHDAMRLAAEVLPRDRTVVDYASSPVHSVGHHQLASIALEYMRTHRIRHVAVLSRRRLCGVVSLRDIVHVSHPKGDDPPIGHLVDHRHLHSARPTTSLQSAAETMADWHVGCLPITRPDGTPHAILTRTDVLRALADHLAAQATDLVATAS